MRLCSSLREWWLLRSGVGTVPTPTGAHLLQRGHIGTVELVGSCLRDFKVFYPLRVNRLAVQEEVPKTRVKYVSGGLARGRRRSLHAHQGLLFRLGLDPGHVSTYSSKW